MSATSEAVLPRYGFGDELASSVIHGIGILLSIAGLAILVVHAAADGTASDVLASAVYGVSLILLYTASTLYHTIRSESARRMLRTLDHIAIFLLIAGTYTPFTLIALRGAWGWSLFGIVWSLALLGSALELGLLKRYRRFAVLLYVAMGWVGIWHVQLDGVEHAWQISGVDFDKAFAEMVRGAVMLAHGTGTP